MYIEKQNSWFITRRNDAIMQYGKSALGKKVIEGATNSPAVAALRWDLLRLDR